MKCYLAFVSDKAVKNEIFYDVKMNEESEQQFINETPAEYVVKTDYSSDDIRKKSKKILLNGRLVYQRSLAEVIKAKEQAGWRCEINPKHETFIAESNDKPYVEAHHLIPMAVQDHLTIQ